MGFYHELVERLSTRYRVFTFQGRGVLPKTESAFPRTMSDAADEIDEALSVIGDRRGESPAPMVLLGHSFGAAVVLEYLLGGTRSSTERLGGAVLISPFSSGRMIRTGIQQRVADLPDPFHDAYRNGGADAKERMGLAAEYWFPTHFCRVSWPESLKDALGRLNGAYMTHFIGDDLFDPTGELMSWSRDEDISRVGVPTLIMSGEWDYFLREDLLRIQEQIPRCELWIGSEASHCGWLEQPAEFYSVFEGFIASAVPG